jgi:hypothetical protein
LRRIHLGIEIGIVRQSGVLAQQRVELRLDRADADPLAVGGLVGVVEVRAGIEQFTPRSSFHMPLPKKV